MPVAVPIVAGTAMRGVAAHMMMRGVLERHPNAFLITLQSFGVTVPLSKSQEHIAEDIEKELKEQGRSTDSPLVLVGHSQGGLAVLRYAIDHPEQVKHVFPVGCPWHGSSAAARAVNVLNRFTKANIIPAVNDMAPQSEFLQGLHEDLPQIANKVTNIYSTHELLIRPYVSAHIDTPGVENILIATQKEYERHLRTFPELPIDGIIDARANHASEMNTPEVRSLIWEKVTEISDELRRKQTTKLPSRQRKSS